MLPQSEQLQDANTELLDKTKMYVFQMQCCVTRNSQTKQMEVY